MKRKLIVATGELTVSKTKIRSQMRVTLKGPLLQFNICLRRKAEYSDFQRLLDTGSELTVTRGSKLYHDPV